MSTLFICRGLPASGKTTRARAWVAEEPTRRARVNRDDLRAMLRDSVWLGAGPEVAIVAARDATIRALLALGYDVVSDDTNLERPKVEALRAVAFSCGAAVEVWDMRDVPVDECIERDIVRDAATGSGVGEHVIRELAKLLPA